FLLEFFVEAVVLDEGFDAVFFQEAVVFLTAISRIGCAAGGIKAVELTVFFQMGFEGQRIGGIGMQGVVDHKLPVGAELKVVGGLELAVFHVVFLHPHESGIGIGFGVAVSSCE